MRFWRDQPAAERKKMERQLVLEALTIQGKFLGRAVTREIREAVRIAELDRDQAELLRAEHGRKLTPRERDEVLIRVLVEQGRLTEDEAAAERKAADKLVEEKEHDALRTRLLADHAYGKDLKQWDENVRVLRSFRKPTLQRRIDILHQEGLVPLQKLAVSQEALYAAGKEYLEYREEAERRFNLADSETDPVARDRAFADLNVWAEQQDKPQHGLPSFVRLAVAEDTPATRGRDIARTATLPWHLLSSLDKERLGKTARFAGGWKAYTDALAEYELSLPAGERRVTADQKLAVAKQVNRRFPGFIRDWQFAKEPLYRRLRELKPVVESENASDWRWLLGNADVLYQAVQRGDTPRKQADEVWGDYMRQTRPWIQENRPRFHLELQGFEDAGRASFLFNLLR